MHWQFAAKPKPSNVNFVSLLGLLNRVLTNQDKLEISTERLTLENLEKF